ncbi:MAG: hypothetical protein A4E19_00600 [Nitrospira sp. SG-bin1]|nr:MAG: hypothetical protein A4E19_00600 [Nitrospira sp. SG-bin1]
MPVHPWMTRGFLIVSLLFSPTMADAREPEHVSIQTLLSPQASSYQRHMVTMHGVANNIEIIPAAPPRPSKQPCLLVYGRATFTLDDETGSLPVEVLGSCSPNALDVLPKEGETVRLTGTVHVLKSDHPRHVIVQAATIQILDTP